MPAEPVPAESGPAADASLDPPVQPAQLGQCVEAMLLLATEPLPADQLAAALGSPLAAVEAALAELRGFYDETGRGFELREVGGGWRLWTRRELAATLNAAIGQTQQARLSQAALETLAVVAYLQPVSRARVAAVRGVNVDSVMRTLASRDLIAEVDTSEQGAALFTTTAHFLERIGLRDLSELPELAPHLPDATDLEAELRDA